MTALQTQLPIRAQSLCRLLDVHCVRREAGLNEDEALALAKMDWGFDISTAVARRIELRLLPASVDNFITAGGTKRLNWNWEQVRDSLIKAAPVKQTPALAGRAAADFIEGKTAHRILNCSPSHIMNLIDEGQIRRVAGTTHGTGPTGSPKITVESFLEFLRKRRVR